MSLKHLAEYGDYPWPSSARDSANAYEHGLKEWICLQVENPARRLEAKFKGKRAPTPARAKEVGRMSNLRSQLLEATHKSLYCPGA